jgi:ammonium transporter, Amt family
MSAVLYPVFSNWVWGGGWLAAAGVNFGLGHGVVDFAGSSVVHMTGGATALAGALTSLFYVWQRHRRPDVAMACNGLLGGLVAITASCAFVAPAAAALIGVVAGLLVPSAVEILEGRLRVDDPVGAIPVHGVCGAWGTLAVGLFADGSFGDGWNGVDGPVRGLLFGDPGQLAAQALGVVTNVVVVFGASVLFFRAVERLLGNRVDAEVEMAGLDGMEMGSDAYPRD